MISTSQVNRSIIFINSSNLPYELRKCFAGYLAEPGAKHFAEPVVTAAHLLIACLLRTSKEDPHSV